MDEMTIFVLGMLGLFYSIFLLIWPILMYNRMKDVIKELKKGRA